MSSRKDDPRYPNPYSSGGHKQPLAVATHGKKYRVREEDGSRLWGQNLTFQEAHKLKEKVCGARQSKTALIEEMTIAFKPQTVTAAQVATPPPVVVVPPLPLAPPPVVIAESSTPANGTSGNSDLAEALANEALDDDAADLDSLV